MMGSFHNCLIFIKNKLKSSESLFGDSWRENSYYTPLAKDWSVFIRQGHLL